MGYFSLNMSKFITYFSLAMSVVYIMAGAYFLFGPYLFNINVSFEYAPILGGLVLGYGIFRLYRGILLMKNSNEEV